MERREKGRERENEKTRKRDQDGVKIGIDKFRFKRKLSAHLSFPLETPHVSPYISEERNFVLYTRTSVYRIIRYYLDVANTC